MEQDILSQIYYGKIVPWDSQKCRTPAMEELKKQISSETDRLEELLDKEGKELLEKLLDDNADLEGRMVCEGFRDGFRFGVQIMLAAMGGTMP